MIPFFALLRLIPAASSAFSSMGLVGQMLTRGAYHLMSSSGGDDQLMDARKRLVELLKNFPKIDVRLEGYDDCLRKISDFQSKSEKALSTALKVEGYRLRRELKNEIRAGAPGGRKFGPLSTIRRIMRPRAGNIALYRLASAVRYHQAAPDEVHIGFTGPRLSSTWKRIAERHQQGFSSELREETRRKILSTGFRMMGRGVNTGARPFMLRKSTRIFKTPGRAIIEPFWLRHQAEAKGNIQKNFQRKMRGERI